MSLAMTDSFTISISENGNVLENRNFGIFVSIAAEASSFGSLTVSNSDASTFV